MEEAIAKLVKNAHNRVTTSIKLGHVSRFIEDDRPYPVVQVTYFKEMVGNVTIIMPYGTSCALPEDTLGIVINVLGDETNTIFIPISTTEREKNLKRGEYVAGNQVKKTYIKFDENGNIEIEGQGDINITTTGNVNIDAQQTNIGIGGKKIALDGDNIVSNKVVASGTNTSI
jgi:hypothetical protein